MGFNIFLSRVLFITTINILAGLSAFAQSSYELACRNKAKEVAAETYKNCVTEQRQSQIEQIRRDYKEKMSELKNHYDNELKKVSGQQSSIGSRASQKQVSAKPATKTMRASGARNLPKKTVKTEVIDLTTPLTESAQVPDESTTQSQNRLNTENESAQDVEIVELPTQE